MALVIALETLHCIEVILLCCKSAISLTKPLMSEQIHINRLKIADTLHKMVMGKARIAGDCFSGTCSVAVSFECVGCEVPE